MKRAVTFVAFFAALAVVAAACGGGNAGVADGSDTFTEGREIYQDSCAVCHGDDGGGGVGAALTEVTATFPDCEEHVRWITIGSSKWRNDVGPTYGAQGREVGGSMPAFEGVRTDAEIRLAATYQRVAFGGESEAVATVACGVAG